MPRHARTVAAAFACALVAMSAPPVGADHSDPGAPLAPLQDLGPTGLPSGAGAWTHIANFGGTTGTDIEFFHRDGVMYASGGQLGQAEGISVGQRILKLVDADGTVSPEWVADHGSGSCGDPSNVSSTTSLQHDAQTTPRATNLLAAGAKPNAELVIDTVDATGRCHDSAGGGLEFIDVSGFGTDGFEPREVHLTRHNGFSHTVTVDATRPWIVYNSTSDFGSDPDSEHPLGIGKSWMDVLDIRTCLGNSDKTLEQKRTRCRPIVYRIPFNYEWSSQEKETGGKRQPAACHDITTRPGRVYCAALNATIVFDVSGLTAAQGPEVPSPDDPRGDIKGTPLSCEVTEAVPAENTDPTAAMVTDCANGGNDAATAILAWEEDGRPSASGWKYLGHVNHPGRECNAPNGASTCNTNLVTPSTEGVAVSHEADPTPDGRYMFVTDERGGGIVPPGATCAPSLDNPYGNGGLHVFDLAKKDTNGRFQYAETPEGEKAVYVSQNVLPSATFCTIHVIEQIPDEQRIIAAWYTQGVKVLDYAIDENGAWTFTEVAGYAYQPNDIWAAEVFKIQNNEDGTRTYWFLSNDIARGMDVFSWTGPRGVAAPGPATAPPAGPGGGSGGGGTTPPRGSGPGTTPATGTDVWLLAVALTALPGAVLLRRRLARG